MSDQLYFRQLLSGRDYGHGDIRAHQLVNFTYLVGDRATGEAMIVDPAHDVDAIMGHLEADGMRLTGVLATHYHADHIGGEIVKGFGISGVAELLEKHPVPVHVQGDELSLVKEFSGIGESDLVVHGHGATVRVGNIPVELIHTPGHTPGSQCFLVADHLMTGDTLFGDGCGHTEGPGTDPVAFFYSITERLAPVPDEAVIYPGHLRAMRSSALLGENRRLNFVFMPKTEAEWMALFGPGGCDGRRPTALVKILMDEVAKQSD